MITPITISTMPESYCRRTMATMPEYAGTAAWILRMDAIELHLGVADEKTSEVRYTAKGHQLQVIWARWLWDASTHCVGSVNEFGGAV